jgi:hypothetical protein
MRWGPIRRSWERLVVQLVSVQAPDGSRSVLVFFVFGLSCDRFGLSCDRFGLSCGVSFFCEGERGLRVKLCQIVSNCVNANHKLSDKHKKHIVTHKLPI